MATSNQHRVTKDTSSRKNEPAPRSTRFKIQLAAELAGEIAAREARSKAYHTTLLSNYEAKVASLEAKVTNLETELIKQKQAYEDQPCQNCADLIMKYEAERQSFEEGKKVAIQEAVGQKMQDLAKDKKMLQDLLAALDVEKALLDTSNTQLLAKVEELENAAAKGKPVFVELSKRLQDRNIWLPLNDEVLEAKNEQLLQSNQKLEGSIEQLKTQHDREVADIRQSLEAEKHATVEAAVAHAYQQSVGLTSALEFELEISTLEYALETSNQESSGLAQTITDLNNRIDQLKKQHDWDLASTKKNLIRNLNPWVKVRFQAERLKERSWFARSSDAFSECVRLLNDSLPDRDYATDLLLHGKRIRDCTQTIGQLGITDNDVVKFTKV